MWNVESARSSGVAHQVDHVHGGGEEADAAGRRTEAQHGLEREPGDAARLDREERVHEAELLDRLDLHAAERARLAGEVVGGVEAQELVARLVERVAPATAHRVHLERAALVHLAQLILAVLRQRLQAERAHLQHNACEQSSTRL